ncbi:hypothetical protein GTY86_06030 [Streptomyces sp. SID5770]|nr:hypothetical protein [Streptomyces sp. SID5770]
MISADAGFHHQISIRGSSSPVPSCRAKNAKTLRDGRLKGDGVHHAPLGVARLHSLTPRRPMKGLWSPGMP